MTGSGSAPGPTGLPLNGLRVLELGGLVSAAHCARQLALLGAEVWKVEPPSGDVARTLGPFRDDRPDPEESGLFIYLNVEKAGLTLNLDHKDAAQVVGALAAQVDVVVENVGQARLAAVGAGFDDLVQRKPGLIVASVTPFGLFGPRSKDQATHLGIFHAGGEGFTLPGGTAYRLFPDREPIQGPRYAAHYDAGTMASIAILVSIVARTIGNALPTAAELIDVSEQEAQLGLNRVEMQRFPQRGFIESRATRDMEVGDILQTQNGYAAVEPLEWRMWKGLCDAMGRPELATDERFSDRHRLYAHGVEATQYIAEWAIRHDTEHVYHTAQQHGCAAGPVRSPRDLFESTQMRGRGFYAAVDGSRYEVPVAPYRMSRDAHERVGERSRLRRPPRLGEHNQEIYGRVVGWSASDVQAHRDAGLI